MQECLIYAEGTTAEEAYCADTCEAGTCGDEQSCSLDEVLCIRDPCPPVAVCTSQGDVLSLSSRNPLLADVVRREGVGPSLSFAVL